MELIKFTVVDLVSSNFKFFGINNVTSLIPQKPIINIFRDYIPEVPEHVEIFTKVSAVNTHTCVLG